MITDTVLAGNSFLESVIVRTLKEGHSMRNTAKITGKEAKNARATVARAFLPGA